MPSGEERNYDGRTLADTGGKVRLFVAGALSAAAGIVPNPSQAHYLLQVMGAKDGDRVRLFNGRDGEWAARLAQTTWQSCTLICETKMAVQKEVPDLWLAFAPVKRTPAGTWIQKATELGVRVLQPVITQRTVVRRMNIEHMRANAIEAAEQSGRLSVPDVRAPTDLASLLTAWPARRRMIFCDEAGEAPPIAQALGEIKAGRGGWGVLTGPEGGFAPQEREAIRKHSFVVPVSLGPRIMPADTAALAALGIWQALCGDWR